MWVERHRKQQQVERELWAERGEVEVKAHLLFITLCTLPALLSQPKTPINQQGGDCTVNTIGDNNTIASLTCNNLDPKLAGQVQAILNAARRSEKVNKDISQKLDLLLKELDRNTIHIQQSSTGANSPNTVNINQKPAPRRIPEARKLEIIALLARYPGTAFVSALQGDTEAFDFAQDWYDVLKAAKWIMTDPNVRVFIQGGRPEPGMSIRFHGEPVAARAPVSIPNDSPVGGLAQSIVALDFFKQVTAQRAADIPANEVRLQISPHPDK